LSREVFLYLIFDFLLLFSMLSMVVFLFLFFNFFLFDILSRKLFPGNIFPIPMIFFRPCEFSWKNRNYTRNSVFPSPL